MNTGSELLAVTYSSEFMSPGEEATLAYSGTKEGFIEGQSMPTHGNNNFVIFKLIMTPGDGMKITGFDGVWLQTEDGQDIMPLFETDISSGSYCGVNSPLQNLNTYPFDGREEVCWAGCYLTYEDLRTETTPEDCNSGRAEWIAVVMTGLMHVYRSYQNGEYVDAIAPAVARAGRLTIKAPHADRSSAYYPLNDTFRRALWDPR